MIDKIVVEEIKKIFSGDVLFDEETLDTYSKDASLLEIKPKLVLFPKNSDDVQKIVRYVHENKEKYPDLSVTVRAAGTDMSGGPINESIILDITKYMHGVLSIDQDKKEAVVLPGTFYRDFEKETLKHGLILPSYTASKNLNAVGGMVGNNSGGEKTLKYGKTEDYIEELKVVFSDGVERGVRALTKEELENKKSQNDFEGEFYKRIHQLILDNEIEIAGAKPDVSKNSAGYYIWNVWDGEKFDLNKLIVGSQGTLGIVTEIKFRLVPVKKKSKLLVVFLKDLKPVSALVNEILPFGPESLESYDDHTMKLAIQFLPSMIKSMGANFFRMTLSFLPEAWMIATGGMPKLILLAEFSGNTDEEIDTQLKAAQNKIAHFGLKTRITKTEKEAEKYWAIRRESFSLLRNHVRGKRTAPFIDDIIVKPEHLPEFMPKLTEILSQYDLIYTIAGHAGDGNFHIIPLMDMKDSHNKEIIREISDKVYDLVVEYGGSITAEHNDGLIRTPYLSKMFDEKILSIFREIKDIFDPKNILNPGKKVGGNLEYVDKHIAEE